ncbi:MAG: WD40/YVTN/BNR-like repeat-containing protein [Thermomicrobiales bacterium]
MGSLPANAGATAVLIDPEQPKRVYAADGASVFRSDDAGQTWQPAGQGLPPEGIATLALDPRQPHRLYATTAGGVLYLSEDGTTSWRLLTSPVDATPTE